MVKNKPVHVERIHHSNTTATFQLFNYVAVNDLPVTASEYRK